MALQIYFNNSWHDLPTPSSMPVTDELVWGSNTGRNSTGNMIGDFKGYKQTIECSWRVLSLSEMQTLRNGIHSAIAENPFFRIRYTDIEGGISSGKLINNSVTKTVYVSNIPRSIYSLHDKHQIYTDVKLTFIEK